VPHQMVQVVEATWMSCGIKDDFGREIPREGKLQEDINLDPEIGIGHGHSC
jgi:hypothetical protein